MSRLTRFAHSLASSYAVLAANALYTLASVPLALKYLSKEGFGVWAVVWQITMYLQVVDFGLTPAISRIIVDVKDRKATGDYATVVLTSWITQVSAGLLVMVLGFSVLPVLPAFLNIPAGFQADFALLAKCQIGLLGLLFLTRIFDQILAAHQRQYLTNYAQIVYFICGYITLCLGFRHGLGLFAMVLANAVAWLCSVMVQCLSCVFTGLLPWRSAGRRFSWRVFRDLFIFGRDTLLTVLGSQLIVASQVLVVSHTLGVAAAATWAIASRLFFLAGQVVWRLFDASLPALSEMMVRGENDRLFDRFRTLVRLTGMCGAAGAVFFAAANPAFLKLWTHGQIAWGRENDVLLAVWLMVISVFHCYSMFIIITKELRGIRFIFLLEGTCFVLIGAWATRRFGISGMLATSILCSFIFHGNYTHRRIATFFKLSRGTVLLVWQKDLATVLIALSAVAIPTILFTVFLRPAAQLAILVGVLVGSAAMLEKFGLLGSTVRTILGRTFHRGWV